MITKKILTISSLSLLLIILSPGLTNALTPITITNTVHANGRIADFATKGKFLFTANTDLNQIQVMDTTHPTAPLIVQSINTIGYFPTSEYVKGNYLFVAEQGQTWTQNGITSLQGNYLEIFKINTLSTTNQYLTSVGSIASVGAQPNNVIVSGNYAYLSDLSGGIVEIINISNPTSPQNVGQINVTFTSSMAISGQYLYILSDGPSGSLLNVFSIATRSKPNLVASYSLISNPNQIVINGNYAYIAGQGPFENQIQVFDITNPTSPILSDTITPSTNLYLDTYRMEFVGHYMFISTLNYYNHEILTYDLNNSPTQPQLIQTFTTISTPYALEEVGSYLYSAEAFGAGNNIEILSITK